MGKLIFLVMVVSLLVIGCGGDSSSGTPASADPRLDSLFATPDAALYASVQADWASRSMEAVSSEVVFRDTFSVGSGLNAIDLAVTVLRHGGPGAWHYGALLNRTGADSLPTLVYAHGGDEGVSLSEVGLVLQIAPELAAFTMVVPSFRSESLAYGDSVWTSQGEPSPWDRDVDDLLTLVSACDSLSLPGQRDTLRGLGFSRGGGVILLAAIRDNRFAKVVDFFGPTDFFGDFVRNTFESAWNGIPVDLPGVDALDEQVALALRDGKIGMDDARQALLRRSPARFAEKLPPVQIHHGGADTVVPIAESETLWAALAARGNPWLNQSAFYVYPRAGHDPTLMIPPFSADDAVARTAKFLLDKSVAPTTAAAANIFRNGATRASWMPNATR